MISVITCTHNPRQPYLERVALALRSQTLPCERWEWIIVDNRSDPSLDSWFDPALPGPSRIVRENELGLTAARLRGIAEARHALLLFVDDDNIIDPDYLESAVAVFDRQSSLGVVGGSIEGEFEVAVPSWFGRREYEMLGVRPLDADIWGNEKGNWRMMPIGAGMVLRAEVARTYAEQVALEESRRRLDRCGTSTVSGGDDDIVNTALAMGYGMGRFARMRLLHLIPKERLELDYLQRLAEGIGYSRQTLNRLNSDPSAQVRTRWFMRIAWLRPWIVRLRRAAPLRAIDKSFVAGERRAHADWPGESRVG